MDFGEDLFAQPVSLDGEPAPLPQQWHSPLTACQRLFLRDIRKETCVRFQGGDWSVLQAGVVPTMEPSDSSSSTSELASPALQHTVSASSELISFAYRPVRGARLLCLSQGARVDGHCW